MKRFGILIITLLTIVSNPSHAQDWRFGLFVDPQLSWFTSDTRRFSSDGPLIGVNIGISAEKYFAERYAIQYGASINNLGGNLLCNEDSLKIVTRDDAYIITANQSVKYRGQYISIPFGLKFKTIEIGYLSIYAHAGVNGNILLKGSVWQDENTIDKEVTDRDLTYFAYGSYFIGSGIEYSLGGASAIQVGLMYNNGFTPIFKDDNARLSMGNAGIRIGIVF